MLTALATSRCEARLTGNNPPTCREEAFWVSCKKSVEAMGGLFGLIRRSIQVSIRPDLASVYVSLFT